MTFVAESIPELPEVLSIRPRVLPDDRGAFFESWHRDKFVAIGLEVDFVQDNQSVSRRNVLRGLHYQVPPAAQGKLVRVVAGEVFDVAVDIRRSSTSFGQWVGRRLSDRNHDMLWIPPGFAHGFYALSERAVVVYKCSAVYSAEHDRTLAWDDPEVGIDWPLVAASPPEVSVKDQGAVALREAEVFP